MIWQERNVTTAMRAHGMRVVPSISCRVSRHYRGIRGHRECLRLSPAEPMPLSEYPVHWGLPPARIVPIGDLFCNSARLAIEDCTQLGRSPCRNTAPEEVLILRPNIRTCRECQRDTMPIIGVVGNTETRLFFARRVHYPWKGGNVFVGELTSNRKRILDALSAERSSGNATL